MKERISVAEDKIKDINTAIKENKKSKKFLSQNSQEIQDTMKIPNLRIMGIEEGQETVSKLTKSGMKRET